MPFRLGEHTKHRGKDERGDKEDTNAIDVGGIGANRRSEMI